MTASPTAAPVPDVLTAIRTRRVVRGLTAEPVTRVQVETVVEAARWAPRAGGRWLQRLVAVLDPRILRVLRMVSPGMLQHPAAAVVICTDLDAATSYGFRPAHPGLSVDVGTTAATMLLAAHGIGLASGPVTSFSRAAVGVVLDLPDAWRPELVVCLGHPAPSQPSSVSRGGRPADVVRWERGPGAGPS